MKTDNFQRIEKAIYFLIANAKEQPSLKDLAQYLKLSEYHCHRLFKEYTGITPKDFLQFTTLSMAKDLLRQSQNLLDTSYEIGLSGPSRLHDLFIHLEAMTPGEYKNGGENLEIFWDTFATALGMMVVGTTARGICSLHFIKKENEGLKILKLKWPKATFIHHPKFISPIAKEIHLRIRGEQSTSLTLVAQGTPFQLKVWESLLKIPEGQVTNYQTIARLIDSPKSSRAVGSAVGANPIGYLIPCHRVIRSTGIIGDYHWGKERKSALLTLEIAKGLM
jgi:AraC family transcriptional regulator of adaptative response/methylated-DNA-[protein]-cysteine methyltransferase